MNKSECYIKEGRLIPMLSAIFLFLFGCASLGPKVHKVEKYFIDDINKRKDMNIGLIEIKSFHLGSTGRQAAFGYLGAIKTSEEKEYAYNLDMKYCKIIEQAINEKALFRLETEQLRDIPKLEYILRIDTEDEKREKREVNAKLVKQFIDYNDIKGALFVKCSYTLSGYIYYKLGLHTNWIMYDYNGREAINMTTYYETEESKAFANTLDPSYEAALLKCFKISTNDFLSVLMKDN